MKTIRKGHISVLLLALLIAMVVMGLEIMTRHIKSAASDHITVVTVAPTPERVVP